MWALWIGIPVSWVEVLCAGVPQNSVYDAKFPGLFVESYEAEMFENVKILVFPQLAKSSTAVGQPSTSH